MKFVWDMEEKEWDRYPAWINACVDGDGIVNTAGVVGCCRVGNLVFDIRAWGQMPNKVGLGYELYVGGVDNGYNWTSDGYPYDLVDDYGEFPIDVIEMDLKDFESMAEKVFEKFINDVATRYKHADLIAKANEPLHVW